MNIIRWTPFRDLVTAREKMNCFFEEDFTSRGEEKDMAASTWTPSVDIYENENELVLSAETPGIEDKDIEIKIENNTLSIEGERKIEKETKEENYHRIERSYGSFYRSFTLPTNVNQDNIKAEYDNGILRISMPKKPELKPKKVKVLKPKSESTK
jgi:HSP20 family protein